MNSPQEIAELIRKLSSKKQIAVSKMLSDLEIGRNALSHLDNGSMMKADNLAKIAEYFEVSTDYLLGIKSEPDISGNIPADFYILQDNLSSTINFEIEKLDDDQKKHLLTYIKFMQEQDKIAADEPVAASIKTKFSI